jgi:hypothetical protein
MKKIELGEKVVIWWNYYLKSGKSYPTKSNTNAAPVSLLSLSDTNVNRM